MVIQGTQVPMYTKPTVFVFFWFFNFYFILFLYEKQNKQNWKKPNKNMLNKAKHKTRLTQKVKQDTQEMQTKTRR